MRSVYSTIAGANTDDSVGLGLLVVWIGALQIMLDIGKEHDGGGLRPVLRQRSPPA